MYIYVQSISFLNAIDMKILLLQVLKITNKGHPTINATRALPEGRRGLFRVENSLPFVLLCFPLFLKLGGGAELKDRRFARRWERGRERTIFFASVIEMDAKLSCGRGGYTSGGGGGV